MSSTNKTPILSLNQYQGTDKPSYLDYNSDMAKIDSAMLGWCPIDATVTYISELCLKANSDLTGFISKGMKIKLTQDSATKYFTVSEIILQNINETVIILDGCNTYSLTDSAITQVCFSTQESPFNFPVNNINDMFNPKIVPNGTDFNTLKSLGWYYQDLDAQATNMINSPLFCNGIKYSFIMQVKMIGNTLIQDWHTYTGYRAQRTYQSWNGTWTAWRSSNPPVLLWEGQVQLGSIAISGLNLYSSFIINIGGAYCFGFSDKSTDYIYVSTSWVADNNVMGTLACSFQKTGDALTMVSKPSYMFHNGSSTHGNRLDSYVYSVYGLL